MQINFLSRPQLALMLSLSFWALFSPAFCFSQDQAVSPERFAKIEELDGEVQVKASAADGWKIAEEGMKIFQGGEILTGKESKVVLLIDEQDSAGKVDVYSNTQLRMGVLGYSEKDGAKVTLLDLALGQVLVNAQGVAGDGSFQVRTPTSASGVRGEAAIFEVRVEDEE